MHRRPSLVWLALLAASCAPLEAQQPPAADAGAVEAGPAYVALLGNYAGKHIRIWIDGRLADDRRFMFPPPGAVDRLIVESGPARTVRVRIEIEACPTPWEADIAVAPLKDTSLIFEGCAVTAARPE